MEKILNRGKDIVSRFAVTPWAFETTTKEGVKLQEGWVFPGGLRTNIPSVADMAHAKIAGMIRGSESGSEA